MKNLLAGLFLIGLIIGVVSFMGSSWTGGGQTAGTSDVGGKDLSKIAVDLELDQIEFEQCLDSSETKQLVQEEYLTGREIGVTGTPGNVLYDTQTQNAWLVSGALPFSQMQEIIDTIRSEGDLPDVAEKVENVTLPDNEPTLGSEKPRIILIEYSDFECPYCKRFHPTAKRLVEENEDLAWVYRNFPLDQAHKYARDFAAASECAYELGGNDAFWQYADRLYE